MILQYLGWIIASAFAMSLLVYLLTVLSLDKKSIRKEFYRAPASLAFLGGALIVTIVIQPAASDPAFLGDVLRWSPLVAVLLIATTLPALARAWTTSGRNPRRRPNYEPTVAFKTIGDELRAMRTIVRLERETVKGSKSARARLKQLRHVRRFFMRKDPLTMNVIRRDLARDRFPLAQAMQRLDP